MEIAFILNLYNSALKLHESEFSVSPLFAIYSTNIYPMNINIFDVDFAYISGSAAGGSVLFLENA